MVEGKDREEQGETRHPVKDKKEGKEEEERREKGRGKGRRRVLP
jgi:hypothetical protein